MKMLYNFFVSGTGVSGLATTIANAILSRFNIVGTAAHLTSSITSKLQIIYRAYHANGQFSWTMLGGVILDLGQFLVNFVPAAGLWRLVPLLWDIASAL